MLRHVSPNQLRRPTTAKDDATRGSLSAVLAGCLALTATAASFPVIATWWVGNLSSKDDALTAPQVRRGAFLNSGSRDVGKDPNWDFKKGEHKNGSGYAVVAEEQGKGLSPEYYALDTKTMAKHAAAIEGFAKGKVNPRREAWLKEKERRSS